MSSDLPLRLLDRALLGLLVLLNFVAGLLAIDRVISIGEFVGRSWDRLGAPRTQRVRQQLSRSLPEFDAAEIEATARGVFVHFGRGLAELLLLRGRHQRDLLERVRVEGLEHVESAERATGVRGALIVTAHLGNWELACAKVASLGIPISVVYRGIDQPALDRALRSLRDEAWARSENASVLEQIPMGRAGIRVVRALEAGRKVLVLLDQDARREEGVFVSFFGRSASTRSGPLALAALRGVPVLPAFVRRESDGRTHCVRIHPALQLEQAASDDEEALRRNVQQITALIEKEIRVSPEQWIWTHRRWRTQPLEVDRNAMSE